MTDKLQDVIHLQLAGDDARAAAEMLVAGFFALWLVDDIHTPEYLEHYRGHLRNLKQKVSPEAALRVLQCVSRAHPNASALLASIEKMRGLPW